LENGVGFHTVSQAGGVLEDDVTLQSIKIYAPNDDEQKEITVISNAYIEDKIKNVTPADIISSISYFFNLLHGVGNTDDIDHLGNRRLRSVGELLQNQFRIGLSRMERVVRERMSINDTQSIVP
ncbi:DNA-directed RNA polymerase subunit beta, partial [Streptococcus pneumoniae]|nr:DNA-directed RNA polymerase subunit beta [Streptococcus pneumoniae]